MEPVLEITESRNTELGGVAIRRALPRRGRRTVGAWCFVDHMGPASVTETHGLDVGPHPHIGLQTVTWLLEGEVLHRDSLGSEQLIRPGELNLMTAGHGVSHAEEATGAYRGPLQGVQLWVAQPDATRHGQPAFEHHSALPQVELDECTATVLVGDFAGGASPARRDTEHVGVDLHLRRGRHEIRLRATQPTRALLIGGVPFPEQVSMWWNYVARTQAEISAAHADWNAASPRFGTVASVLPRVTVGPPPWSAQHS